MNFDAQPLTGPVDRHEVAAFARELRARGSLRPSGWSAFAVVIAVIVGAVVVPLTLIGTLMTLFTDPADLGRALLPAAVFVVIGVVALVVTVSGWRRSRVTRYRLSRFAAANGMTYEPRIVDPPLPGMIFGLGHSRTATDLVRGTYPRFVEFGNHQYTVRHGKNSTTHRWGYVAVKLDVPLPNIVLDAKGNNGFGTNLPASFHKAQRLSLEGDFDRYFDLYCPAGYERDALYLFTPDIMARFIDNAAELDVEIVDDWLFLYTRRKASSLDPATWAWLFGAVGALLAKLDQWARWRDERMPVATASAPAPADGALPFAAPVGMLTPPPGVAHEGRRLKRSASWVTIVAAIAIGAVYIAMRIADLAH
ncbi:hypothetical protein [Microbacterium sp.]|uniref:hypothetical protein n=1 Tax=Microbacterium sp. TaxID=51671 RepID=UPI0039E22739